MKGSICDALTFDAGRWYECQLLDDHAGHHLSTPLETDPMRGVLIIEAEQKTAAEEIYGAALVLTTCGLVIKDRYGDRFGSYVRRPVVVPIASEWRPSDRRAS